MGGKRKLSWPLFRFDQPFIEQYGVVAGVDEAGRGPLAGPVVSAAVILPRDCRIPHLNDSKKISAEERRALYRVIQSTAVAIGVGVVEHHEVDRLNIYWASFSSMKIALSQLIITPAHVLVDGFKIPDGPASQTRVVGGDDLSASIAAASIIAKVTRDCVMDAMHRLYPEYGFDRHRGYSTPHHLKRLRDLGPCPIHRRSFWPVKEWRTLVVAEAIEELTDDESRDMG